MKFKTTIKLITDADNKNEAIDLVGDYLSGNLISGIDMKCSTKPIQNYKKVLLGGSIITISFLLTMGILSSTSPRPTGTFIRGISNIDAVQLPLKTHASTKDENDSNFKKEWETKQQEEALNHIKK